MTKDLLSVLKRNTAVIWIIIIILILALFASLRVNTNDFWWLLALGRNFWQTGQITNYDFLSYTVPGGFFWNHSRLFDILIYWLYEHGGWLALQIMMFGFLTVSYLFYFRTTRLKKSFVIISLLIIALTLIPLRGRILYRPELVTLLLTNIFLFILFKYKYQRSKLIWFIPLLQLIWANGHAGFIYGLALTGIFFGGELIRALIRQRQKVILIFRDKYLLTWGAVFFLSAGVCLLTSYVWQIIPLVYGLMLNQEAKFGIKEWSPYELSNLLNIGNPLTILIFIALLVLVIRIYRLPKAKRLQHLPYEYIFLFILYLYSLLSHVRFTHLTSLVMGLIIALNIRKILPSRWVINQWWPHVLLLVFSLLVILNIKNQSFGIGPIANYDPKQAVNFIKEQKVPGNMLNEYGEGGYLAFNLYPEKQIFIDGRTPNLYDNDFFWRYSQLTDSNIRRQIIDTYDINFWLWPRQNKLQETLWQDPDWKLIYFDSVSTVYLKNNEANQSWLDKFTYKFFPPFGDEEFIKDACGQHNAEEIEIKENFINELTKGLEANQANWLHYKNLALVYQHCNYDPTDLEKILDNLNQALSINPGDKDSLFLLGHIHLQKAEYEQAAHYFKKSGQTVPSLVGLATAQYNLGQTKKALKNLLKARSTGQILDNKFYQTLGRVYYNLDKDDLAIEFYHRYQDISQDFSAESYTDLAQAYYYNGQMDLAEEYLNKALAEDADYPIALELKSIMEK